MVNPRAKGAKGEEIVLEFLRKHTSYHFERTPGSGNGNIKGDLYIPGKPNTFIIEVKNYAESPISDKILTNDSNDFVKWWDKLTIECFYKAKEPLLFFRYNRSKLFVVVGKKPANIRNYIDIGKWNCYIMIAEDWITKEKISWLRS